MTRKPLGYKYAQLTDPTSSGTDDGRGRFGFLGGLDQSAAPSGPAFLPRGVSLGSFPEQRPIIELIL